MKAFLCTFFLATAALAMPHHGGYPGPSHHGFPGHHGGPSHGHYPQPHPYPPMHQQRPPQMPRELREFVKDLKDFSRLIPSEQIDEILMSHWEDEQLHATIDYMETEEFYQTMKNIGEAEEVAAIAQYLKNASWPWIRQAMTEEIKNLDDMSQRIKGRNAAGTGGLSGLLEAVIAVLPKEELRALYEEKMENREVFRAVVEVLTSEQMKQLVENVNTSEVIRGQFQTLASNGFDVQKVYQCALAFFGL